MTVKLSINKIKNTTGRVEKMMSGQEEKSEIPYYLIIYKYSLSMKSMQVYIDLRDVYRPRT
jgi:hypothetical protein